MNHELFILDLLLVAKRSPRFLGNGYRLLVITDKMATLLQTWGTTATVGGLSVIVAIVIEVLKLCRLVFGPSLSSQGVDNHSVDSPDFYRRVDGRLVPRSRLLAANKL